MQGTTRNGIRLISFDGGGARALSQLKILESLMYRLQYDIYPDDPDKVLLPCECFDLMGGSDMGGTVAIMFSRLRMSVEEVAEDLHKICSGIYIDDLSPEERTRHLKECIEDLLEGRGLPIDLKLGRDSRVIEDGCPCFVMATLKININDKIKLRSYRTRTGPATNASVVEAILATCAMQPTFAPISVGPSLSSRELVSGAMGAGNPCRELILEACDKFKGDARASTIVSLGSGNPGTLSTPKDGNEGWMDILRTMVTNCEEVAKSMEMQMGHLGVYFRFSVDRDLQKQPEMDSPYTSWLTMQTEAYLQGVQVSRMIDQCLESLRLRQGLVTMGQLKHTDSQAIYKDVPALTTYFVMREEPWKRMKFLLDQDGSTRKQRVLVISGMAGCGKTQLLIQFTNEFRSKFRHVFFIDSSSKESIQADLINHVRTTSPAYSQATFADALSFFSNSRNLPWLITYDNCNDVELDLQSLIPNCSHGSIILTTRNRSRGQFASEPGLHLELEVMSDEEAVEVILKSARLEDSEESRQSACAIATELGNLPVALAQAGSYIFQTQCSCVEYLNRLRNFKSDMMRHPTADREHRSAYAAFELTYRQLPTHARRFLHLLGCLHFANFPMVAISVAAKAGFRSDPFEYEDHGKYFDTAVESLTSTFYSEGKWDERILDNLVLVLQNYSLASFSRSITSLLLRMHPLLHTWVFDYAPLEERVIYQMAAYRLIACLSEEVTLHQYLVSHIDALRTHPIDQRIPVNDLAVLGKVLGKMGRVKDSQILRQKIYDSMMEMHGSKDLRTATAATELAEAIGEEDLGKTEQLEMQAFEIRKIKLGVDSLDTLKVGRELAGTYRMQGRYTEAEILLTDAMDRVKDRFGPEHLETMESMNALAELYQSQERYSEAEPLQEQVFKVRKERLGSTHLDTIGAMHSLTLTYRWLGRYSDAQQLQKQVLKIRKERLGDDHPDTLWAMHNVARIHYSQDRYLDAQQLQEQVLSIQKERLGDAHSDTLFAMHQLAVTYFSLRRYSDAMKLQEQVLEKRRLGDNQRETATSTSNLAWTYYCLGQLTQARELAVEAEQLKRKILGIDNQWYQQTAGLLQDIDAALARPKSIETLSSVDSTNPGGNA